MSDTDAQPGKRIVVFGTSGSGKTYIAQRLADRLGIRYICNDEIIHGPNWTTPPAEQQLARFDEATAGDAWTLDGNFLSLKDPQDRLVLRRADTVVWLDLPRRTVYRQVVWRTFLRSLLRTELWHGNRENWRMSFASRDSIILWAIRTYRRRQQQGERFFADPQWEHLRLIRLRSRREVNRWLAAVDLPAAG
jgi:adenylate kinase family enzyme